MKNPEFQLIFERLDALTDGGSRHQILFPSPRKVTVTRRRFDDAEGIQVQLL